MPFFVGAGSKRLNIIGIVAVVIGGALVYFFGIVPNKDHRADVIAAWDRGEGRPASVVLVRRDDADVMLALPKTISPEEVSEYWNTCPRHCQNHEILRYAFVYHIRELYNNATVTDGPPENKCWTFAINTLVRELRIASTVDGLTLTYQRDGKALVVCYVSSAGPSDDAKVVVWSESSPFDYTSY